MDGGDDDVEMAGAAEAGAAVVHLSFSLPSSMLCCVCLISDSFCFHCFGNPKREYVYIYAFRNWTR